MVRHIHFHLHGARLRIERTGRAHDRAVELLTGEFLKDNLGE